MPYKDPEKARANRESRRESINANATTWRKEHRAAVNAYAVQWRLKNPRPGVTQKPRGRRPHTPHGLCDTPIHTVWLGMRERCFNLKHVSYHRYGGRGITVCQRWDEFPNFYADMSPTYQKGLTLDRINNNRDYTPENCRWVPRNVQANNKSSSRLITYQEEPHTEAEWARILNIKRSTLQRRLNSGWPFERILAEDVSAHGHGKLSDEAIRAIRALEGKLSQKNVGAKFGIAQSTVSKIWRRERFAHVPDTCDTVGVALDTLRQAAYVRQHKESSGHAR